MSVDVKQSSDLPFEKNTIEHWLKALNWSNREFVQNADQGLVYHSGDVTITMHGYVAGDEGSQPKGWDLNNSQIRSIEFSNGSHSLEISGFAMDLRETFHANTLDSFRNWRHLTNHENYKVGGSSGDDVLTGANDGRNLLIGHNGDDKIYSTGYRDMIHSGLGDDVVHIDNDGKAKIWGGTGSDTFVIDAVGEHNVIRDFRCNADVLDLRGIAGDMMKTAGADGRDVSFIGEHGLHGDGVEIGIEHHYQGSDGTAGSTTVELSVNGTVSDLVELHGIINLGKDDFML
jgi:hypothetical protein